MTTDSCRQWRELLGAHVLGGLTADERVSLDAHLEGCAECRAERAGLAPMAEILPLADPQWLDAAPAPPGSLGRRVARRVATERRNQQRRRIRVGFALGGATTVAAAALAVLLIGGSQPAPAPAGRQVEFAHLPRGVRIAAHLEPRPYGSEVNVYVHGMQRGTRCVVFLRGPNGQRVSAGSFRYSYQGEAGSGLSAAMRLPDVRAVGIRAGHRVFMAPIAPGSA